MGRGAVDKPMRECIRSVYTSTPPQRPHRTTLHSVRPSWRTLRLSQRWRWRGVRSDVTMPHCPHPDGSGGAAARTAAISFVTTYAELYAYHAYYIIICIIGCSVSYELSPLPM